MTTSYINPDRLPTLQDLLLLLWDAPRFIDRVKAKGKTQAVGLLEVFSADPPALKSAKMATKTKFEKAVLFYHSNSFQAAAGLFQECLDYHSGDRVARIYLDRCLKS